jgi:hypothetical protein
MEKYTGDILGSTKQLFCFFKAKFIQNESNFILQIFEIQNRKSLNKVDWLF